MKTCTAERCHRPVAKRDICSGHYKRRLLHWPDWDRKPLRNLMPGSSEVAVRLSKESVCLFRRHALRLKRPLATHLRTILEEAARAIARGDG